jgi:hypothetical protein
MKDVYAYVATLEGKHETSEKQKLEGMIADTKVLLYGLS